jgi:hypothetical protein
MSSGSVDEGDLLVLATAALSTSVVGMAFCRVVLLVDDDDEEMEKAEEVPVSTADVRQTTARFSLMMMDGWAVVVLGFATGNPRISAR